MVKDNASFKAAYRTIYRDIAHYAVKGYKLEEGELGTDEMEKKVVDLLNVHLVVEEFAALFVAGYLATRPLKWAFRIGKRMARRG